MNLNFTLSFTGGFFTGCPLSKYASFKWIKSPILQVALYTHIFLCWSKARYINNTAQCRNTLPKTLGKENVRYPALPPLKQNWCRFTHTTPTPPPSISVIILTHRDKLTLYLLKNNKNAFGSRGFTDAFSLRFQT